MMSMWFKHKLIFLFVLFFVYQALLSGQAVSPSVAYRQVAALQTDSIPSGPLKDAVALDLDPQGNVFIVDRSGNRLIKFSPEGRFIREVGGFGNGSEQFNDPRDVFVFFALSVYVADYNNNRILRFDNHLNYIEQLSGMTPQVELFEWPLSVVVSRQFDFFILEGVQRSILKINRVGEVQATFGGVSDNLGQLVEPYQMATNRDNRIFISDPGQQSVLIFDYLGNFLKQIQLSHWTAPTGISVNYQQKLVVCDPPGKTVDILAPPYHRWKTILLEEGLGNPVDAVLREEKGRRPLLYLLTSWQCYLLELQ